MGARMTPEYTANLDKNRGLVLNIINYGSYSILIPFGLGFAMVLFLPCLWGAQIQLAVIALFMGTAPDLNKYSICPAKHIFQVIFQYIF